MHAHHLVPAGFLIAASVTITSAQAPATSRQPARGNPVVELAGQSIDGMIAGFMAEHDVAGMSVAIVQAPYITRITGFGVGNREQRTLVSANTMFDIAQMKDAFTAVAVMQLVDAGKIALDDAVGRLVPGTGEGRSVRQLLRTAADYARLESLVEAVSGQTYEAFVTKGQFEPLGLRHTFFGSELDGAPHERIGAGGRHARFLREPALIDPTEPATGYRSATAAPRDRRSIYSTAGDVSIWDIGLAGAILVKDPALRRILYVPAVENGAQAASAGAWQFPGHEGLMVSTGSRNGFSSLLSRFTHPDELLCVTLLANREGLDLSELAHKIAAAHNPSLKPGR